MLRICKFIFSITIGTIYLSKGERFIMKTGERIKTIRKSQGITQAKLAETLHISSSFMSRIENGSSSLTLDFVCEIADALQVTRQEVLRDVFTYAKDDNIPISKKIEINIQKFSPEKQAEILDVLEFLASRLS
ncbi:helix-turn-helix domain-containing protein [[Clostridium] scindens]|uniref:Helix-turn-helix domain-containing protein n=2 Tax=Lachnospirales TaxID=3085636 RepID=A0A844FAU6_CLOSV|nr:helix-turn-helix domain-containing protein [[Clostridium] scindens]